MGVAMSLERELRVFHAGLSDMLGVNDINEGKYAVVKGDVVKGPFETYDDALTFAYETYGLSTFLIKKIERHESVMFFARSLR